MTTSDVFNRVRLFFPSCVHVCVGVLMRVVVCWCMSVLVCVCVSWCMSVLSVCLSVSLSFCVSLHVGVLISAIIIELSCESKDFKARSIHIFSTKEHQFCVDQKRKNLLDSHF